MTAAQKTVFIGTDPGGNGAIVALQDDATVAGSIRLSKSTDQEIYEFYKTHGPQTQIAVVERVHAMPGQGVSSTFKFGKTTGALLMAHTATGLRHEEITPRSWQKYLGIKKKQPHESKTDFKRRLKQEAQRLFPQEKIVNENADAYLIAEFCRRKYGANFGSGDGIISKLQGKNDN